jgi:hypothetical protein
MSGRFELSDDGAGPSQLRLTIPKSEILRNAHNDLSAFTEALWTVKLSAFVALAR